MYKDASVINTDVVGVNAIRNSIKNILTTQRGSLPGKPRFGSDLYKVLFRQLDHLTESLARNYIKESISEFEQRINITEINFKRVEEFNKLVIELKFTYVDSQFNNETDELAISFQL